MGKSRRVKTKRRRANLFFGGSHEEEVSLMWSLVYFKRLRQAPKILLRMRQTWNGAGAWFTGL
jgi:hypothetical protein